MLLSDAFCELKCDKMRLRPVWQPILTSYDSYSGVQTSYPPDYDIATYSVKINFVLEIDGDERYLCAASCNSTAEEGNNWLGRLIFS